MASENTAAKHSNLIPFKPGQSGNPAGRPKGSRNKLAEAFLSDVLSEWENHGAVAISDMREKNPGDFCKMVASIVPKEMTLNLNNDAEELSDDEIRDRVSRLASELAQFLGGTGAAVEGAEAQGCAALPSHVH